MVVDLGKEKPDSEEVKLMGGYLKSFMWCICFVLFFSLY